MNYPDFAAQTAAETEALNRKLEEQEQILEAQRWALGMLLALQQARLEREQKARQ